MDLYGRLLGNVLYRAGSGCAGVTRTPSAACSSAPSTPAPPSSPICSRGCRAGWCATPTLTAATTATSGTPPASDPDIKDVRDLARLPVLEKPAARASDEARLADAPPWPRWSSTPAASTGTPLTVR
ncbi:MAG: hypothetical protein IPH44_28080 [Myxococcales bacterium]|nr:hypothetical protein [Myxococcales bacterium]